MAIILLLFIMVSTYCSTFLHYLYSYRSLLYSYLDPYPLSVSIPVLDLDSTAVRQIQNLSIYLGSIDI